MIQVRSHKRVGKNKVTVIKKHSRANGIVRKSGNYTLRKNPDGSHYVQHNSTYETSMSISKPKVAQLRKSKVADFNSACAKHINR